jgi:hypothetical protein
MSFVVITSINPPTEAVEAFSKLPDQRVIVVGDRKSPAKYSIDSVRFISLEQQGGLGFELSRHLPENHYSRKMLGYLMAMRQGASSIIDTDDDNIPKLDFGFPQLADQFEKTGSDLGFINIYQKFTSQPVWPRGLPLSQIRRDDSKLPLALGSCNVGIFQGLADGEPDVDAIYRLTDDSPCFFEEREPIVLPRGTWSPFNSQNTLFRKELFPLLYLPTTVTFRYTDILRSFIAQPIMWNLGWELGFSRASVVQIRNPHDYFSDFLSEVPMYETTTEVADIVAASVVEGANIYDSLFSAYSALHLAKVVQAQEILSLEAWLADCQELLR